MKKSKSRKNVRHSTTSAATRNAKRQDKASKTAGFNDRSQEGSEHFPQEDWDDTYEIEAPLQSQR